jgi:exopolyphosphatase/guanosine-5'-triphosphate,3'-diphosphate pyrophosphatase
MMTGKVAVIDVGSNTIKLLVARGEPQKPIEAVHQCSVPARIGTGIGDDHPSLTGDSMKLGLETIEQLLAQAQSHAVHSIRIVSTGAVRSASNGAHFAQQVEKAIGEPLEILSGKQEAHGIASGLLTDPALKNEQDFVACDLGGGSLELILVKERSATATISVPLGAVRLTERFVPNPHLTIPDEQRELIAAHVTQTLAKSGFPFPETVSSMVATGGSFHTARLMLAEREGISFEKRSTLTRLDFSGLLSETASLNLAERHERFPAMPPNRADVMIAAFTCIVALFDQLKVSEAINSLRNLRYGIAAEMLSEG